MEPPSSILTDGNSKADPRSDDPLSRSMFDNQSLVAIVVTGSLSCFNLNS